MLNFTETAVHLYCQIFGTPEIEGQLADGIETVLDGNTAIAITEACVSEVASYTPSFAKQGSVLAWLAEQQRVNSNLFNEKLKIQQAGSARGALASAIGTTQSGHRSSVFLSAHDLASCQDLLHLAVGRRIPLVIHLDNSLIAMQGNSNGSGHEILHQVMDSGCFILVASNVQQAVDFTLIARHVAELTLTPAIVVIDGIETALAAQDVRLPSADLVKQFIGRADELISAPSIAQKQLFSESRRRLHRWHDMDKPVLQGMMSNAQTYALGNSARKVYFESLVKPILEQAYAQFLTLTGRNYASISTQGLKNAEIIFIAQGSAIEYLSSLSGYLLKAKGLKEKGLKTNIKIGVIALHSLRPFNAQELLDLLLDNKCSRTPIVVLEKMEVPLADDSPLMREIRAALHKQQSARKLNIDEFSQLHSIIYGLGGAALYLADLVKLSNEIKQGTLQGRYLGVAFNSTKTAHPKRQVMLDNLQRFYPQISSLGISAKDKLLSFTALQTKSTGQPLISSAISLAINFPIGVEGGENKTAFALDLASYIHKLNGHSIRSYISHLWEQWGVRQTDYINQSESPFETGKSSLVDYYLLISADIRAMYQACLSLNHQGHLLFSHLLFSKKHQFDNLTSTKDQQLWQQCLLIIEDKSLSLYQIKLSAKSCFDNADINIPRDKIIWEKMLGLLMGILQAENKIDAKPRKVIASRKFYLNGLPQEQQSMLETYFKLTMENIKSFDVSSVSFSSDKAIKQSKLIKAKMVESLGQSSQNYDSLSRFWDQVGVLQADSTQPTLTVDPYLATGTLPPLTATFNSTSHMVSNNSSTATLPIFQQKNCTACGDCWTNCPDSAIAVVAMTPKALIESAINISGADAIRQVTSKLASRMAKQCRNNHIKASQPEGLLAADLLYDSLSWLKQESGLAPDRLKSVEEAFSKALPAVEKLPIVTSDLFFYSQEKKQNGSGELFSLVINPDSCKACGLCVELCHNRLDNNSSDESNGRSGAALMHSHQVLEESSANKQEQSHALQHENQHENQPENQPENQHENQSGMHVAKLTEQWNIWQNIIDTSSATIQRLINDHTMGSGAALMLSRYNAFTLSGGDLGEQGSGEKIALRQILSAVEYHQQPILHQFIEELDQLRDALKEEINSSFSTALPTDNLQQLSNKLSDIKTRQIDLNSLLDENTQSIEHMSVDVVKIRQLVGYVLQLNELHWKLSRGEYGLGRSRYSLCITSRSIASWAGSFPNNPFHVPVNIDMSGEAAQIAAGLLQGQISDIVQAISLKRNAKACIDARYAKNRGKLDKLEWQDLDAQEKQLCPPLLLVGGDDLLAGNGFSQISQLLNSPYPIKVVVFSELDGGLCDNTDFMSAKDSRNNLAMMAMSQRNAYVAQTSIANNNHLQQSVAEMLNYGAAGLLRVYTPSPVRHGFKPQHTFTQAQLATMTGMFPLFSYNPDKAGVFGSRISLQTEQTKQRELTIAHWAINEKRFESHFSSLSATNTSAIELSAWLALIPQEQGKKTPYISIQKDSDSSIKLAISNAFSSMAIEQQHSWQTLLELSGIETPFTDYVESCVEERLKAEHQQALDNLKADYEGKISQLQLSFNNETHTKIRNQLLGLAGYNASNLEH